MKTRQGKAGSFEGTLPRFFLRWLNADRDCQSLLKDDDSNDFPEVHRELVPMNQERFFSLALARFMIYVQCTP